MIMLIQAETLSALQNQLMQSMQELQKVQQALAAAIAERNALSAKQSDQLRYLAEQVKALQKKEKAIQAKIAKLTSAVRASEGQSADNGKRRKR